MAYSLADRRAARQVMAESIAGRDLLACERARLEQEGSEPDTLEGLL